MTPVRILLLYAATSDNRTYSYQSGWPRNFLSDPHFICTPLNLGDRSLSNRLRGQVVTRLARYDAVVILHSVFSNACFLEGSLLEALSRVPQPKAYFIGNEYKMLPEKMAFCDRLPLALLVTQSMSPAVHRMYAERLHCPVIGLPNTGLDPAVFAPTTPRRERPIDLGYRSGESAMYLGHQERRDIAECLIANGGRYGLTLDVSLDERTQRFAEREWAAFLNRCKGQLGTEAGGDYFELTDATRNRVNAYVASHPETTFADVYARFFAGYPNQVPIRIISGRNVEAAGTGTVQLLLEGDYGGYLQPDVHYIPLKKDFSNLDDAVAKFRDDEFCDRLTRNAQEVALGELTYARLIARFHGAFAPLVS